MNNLKILHWNSNGISKKLNELHALVKQLNIDIILINETHLKPSSYLHISNNHTYRTDLPPIKGSPAHGGTAVLVHRRIVHQPVSLRTELQSTSIIIKHNNQEILVSAVYKPPNQILDPIDLDTLTQSYDWSISAGDFNSKHPLWHSRTTNTAGQTIFNHAQTNDYSVLPPSTPTYHPYSRLYRPDVLDIGLIKIPMLVNVTNINDLSSDHNPVLLEILGTPISSSAPTPLRSIKWSNYVEKLTNLPMISYPKPFGILDIDRALEKFTSTINFAIQSNSVVKPRGNSNKLPPEIILEIREKNRLRRQWQTTRDPAIKNALNSKIQFIRSIITTYKQDEWNKYLDTVNIQDGSLYRINKCLLHKRPATHPLSGPNSLVFSETDKAELIADSLVNQFSPNPGPDLPEVTSSLLKISSVSSNSKLFTTPADIKTLLSKLPKNALLARTRSQTLPLDSSQKI